MRIVAGRWGGRRLRAPAGTGTRPTSDRVREALFSALGDIEGLQVLDLFAGSGALGLEALSRGAAGATFVDSAPRAVAALRANVAELGAEGADIRRQDALTFLRKAATQGRQYDLFFLDPPYRHAPRLAGDLTALLPAVLAPGGRVVTEADRRAPYEVGLPARFERRYGDTLIRVHDAQ